ncbi:hypothetical protein Tco_1024079 [Tanacetum coccineum]
MTLLNQDLFYMKHDNSRSKKYVLSLHKYSAGAFLENDIEELTSRWAKQYHIKRQEKKRDNHDEVYLESKIVDVVRTSYDLEFTSLRSVHDYQLGLESYQQRVNHTAPTITFPGIKKEKLLTITSQLVVGLIYENNKKEKRVMIIEEILKFCDATPIRVFRGSKEEELGCKARVCRPKS